MPDLDFHFLRPWWLLFIPYALWMNTRLRRAYSATLQWQVAGDKLDYRLVLANGDQEVGHFERKELGEH